MDHVLIRKLEHLTGTPGSPRLGFAVETRDRRGPAHKNGAFEGDAVHVQIHGGLFVARATVKICWIGEYSRVDEVRARTRGTPIHDVDDFWQGRPRVGYAAVAELVGERWLPAPFWAGRGRMPTSGWSSKMMPSGGPGSTRRNRRAAARS